MRWPWQKKAEVPTVPTETRSTDVPDRVFIGRDGGPGPAGYEYSFDDARITGHIDNLLEGFYGNQNFIELFHCLPEIFAPVHEIASRVADCNWQLKKVRNDEVDYLDTQFNRLFTQPNPLMAMKQFVYQAVCYELLTGKQFFYFNKPDILPDEFDSVISWWNLQAQSVTADMKPNVDPYSATQMSDFVTQYRQPVNGRTRTFPTTKVLPLCNLSMHSGWDINKSRSILRGADKAIRNLIPVYDARGVIYIKRGAMGFMVSRKSDESGLQALTKSERDQAIKDFDGTYGITGNKQPIGITSVPLDFVRTAMSIAELQPFEETMADAVAIYACLRVPRHLVPSKDTSTFDNANSDMKSFYSDVIIPWAKRLAEAWTSYMKLGDKRRYIHADFSHVDVLQENRKEKAEVDKSNGITYQQRWLYGACSLNDWIVANGDAKIKDNPLYEKKLFELSPEELDKVKAVINLKSHGLQNTTSPDTGTEAPGIGGQLQ